jgi:F-type H+-transporting ATPase subunit a
MTEVSLAPETILYVFGIRITNTVIATVITDAIIIILVLVIRKNLKTIPGTLQLICESFIEYFHNFTEQIAGKFTNAIFPWFASFFIFIFFANLLGIVPGIGTIGFFTGGHESGTFSPLLRTATSDINLTLALAIVSIVATHALSIRYNGLREYLKRWFSLNPIYLFVGLIELFSEIMKIVSFSFRLFGNIYAGKVVLHTISEMVPIVAPVPFLMLETIIALVQALVFSMLTMVFMSILISPKLEGGTH